MPDRYPRRPRESLREEAARRGVSLARVRAERAPGRGVSREVALGHARPGERSFVEMEAPTVNLGLPEYLFPVATIRAGGRDADRAYRLIKDEKDLLSGRLSRAAWDARWAGKQLGGQKLPSSADILAAARRGDIDEDAIGSPKR